MVDPSIRSPHLGSKNLDHDSPPSKRSSKYDPAILKNDIAPVVVPQSATRLPSSEYSVAPDKSDAFSALLKLEEELERLGQQTAAPEVEQDPIEVGSWSGSAVSDSAARNDRYGTRNGPLPCPRVSGATFSGPNMLVVFDSRVAIGQKRGTSTTGSKLPRTYEELLSLRDARFISKKGKRHKPDFTMPTMDTTFGDDMYDGSTRGGNLFFNEEEPPHSTLDYFTPYFSNADYHLPVNHPDHRVSLPPSSTPGAPTSPRQSTIRTNQSKDQLLNLDLSISVSLLDLSRLCGVSPTLLHGSSDQSASDSQSATLNWMLRASENLPSRQNHLRRMLRSLLEDTSVSNRKVLEQCAGNKKLSTVAGRKDLSQVWSLLELSASGPIQFPLYQDQESPSSHPWSAHPFGRKLVDKVLGMYEQVGDVSALGSIVYALEKPSKAKAHAESKEDWAVPGSTPEQHIFMSSGNRPGGIERSASFGGSPPKPTSMDQMRKINSHNELADIESSYRSTTSRDGGLFSLAEGSEASSALLAEDHVTLHLHSTEADEEEECHQLLSDDMHNLEKYDTYKQAYADLLYRHGASEKRAEVLKIRSRKERPHVGLELGLLCRHCNQPSDSIVCPSCKQFALQCVICQLVVRGESQFCVVCGHGGHAAHLESWFHEEEVCPTGCGCLCLQATNLPHSYDAEDDVELPLLRSHSF